MAGKLKLPAVIERGRFTGDVYRLFGILVRLKNNKLQTVFRRLTSRRNVLIRHQRIKRQEWAYVPRALAARGRRPFTGCFAQLFGLQRIAALAWLEISLSGRQITAIINCSLIRDAANNRW